MRHNFAASTIKAVAAVLLTTAPCCAIAAQQIAFTMDDLPAHGPLPVGTTRIAVADQIIRALAEAGLPPTYGFINGMRISEQPEDETVLDLWRKSGNLLGNHTWSHMNLNQYSAAEFEADLLKNEPILREKMKRADWHWLRYPFLGEGDTPDKRAKIRQFLADRHYRIAAVTMSFGDYLWNEPYARCAAKGDTDAIAALEQSYLEAAKKEAQYELRLSDLTLGRKIPFVLLMHIGAFDARMLPRLLAAYKSMGFTFISLEVAERDAFYAPDVRLSDSAGPQNLATLAEMKRIALPPPPPENNFDALCR